MPQTLANPPLPLSYFYLILLCHFLVSKPNIIMAMTTSTSGRRGIFMILSPAKTLDLSPLKSDVLSHIEEDLSEPSCDPKKTRTLVDILQLKSQNELKKLLNVSDKISCTVKEYYDKFDMHTNLGVKGDVPSAPGNLKPAIFSFDGPAFKGIHPSTCNANTLQYMQYNLRIIDPLFGALKPLDQIQPYRLEMATKAIIKELDTESKTLAEWWKASITSNILKDMKESQCDVLVNLASDEYASAVDAEQLVKNDLKFIKIAFQQEGKVVAVHAKRARGLMVRYISENQVMNVQDIQNFDLEGYRYCKEKSDENTFVFRRLKNYLKNNDSTRQETIPKGKRNIVEEDQTSTRKTGRTRASKRSKA